MSNFHEKAILMECLGETLIAIHHPAKSSCSIGVVIVVGGPQYRVGSHRQFLQLARYLSANEVPVLRFDYRGMGDSSGKMLSFELVDDDIRAAVDMLMDLEPDLGSVLLWGLCDAASAALMYAASADRVHGLVLANPFVYTQAGEARTCLKHYYLSRLFGQDFWAKIFSGRFAWGKSLQSIADYLTKAFTHVRNSTDLNRPGFTGDSIS